MSVTDNIGIVHPVPDGSGKRLHPLRYLSQGFRLRIGKLFQKLALPLVVLLLFALQYGQGFHELVRHGVPFQQICGIALDHDKGLQDTSEPSL